MKNTKLRTLWIVPNALSYIVFLALAGWVAVNRKGLQDIGESSIFMVALLLLFFVSLFGSYRIWSWMKKEEI